MKGLRRVGVYPIKKNEEKEYEAGVEIKLTGAQNLTKDVQTSENNIYADDELFDKITDFTSENLELTLAQLPLDMEAKLLGAKEEEDDPGVYNFGKDDVAPEYALVYAGLKGDGTFRMFKHPVVKVNKIKVDMKSKDESGDIQPYVLSITSMARKCDGRYRIVKDSADENITWLDTIEQITIT